jgi:hypothetical protein
MVRGVFGHNFSFSCAKEGAYIPGMRWRVTLLIASLLLNLLLLAGWIGMVRKSRDSGAALRPAETNTPLPVIRTNVFVARHFFSWSEVGSDDYRTYIANLRGIGCPEQTIRDIIIADVNALYARRRATEIVTPEQQWWRAEPDTNVVAEAAAEIRQMEADRRELLAGLLGRDWESGDQLNLPRPTRAGVVLDGEILGMLPQEAKSAIQDVANRAAERAEAYIEAQRAAGKPVDDIELARLRQQTRLELAAILTPPQLEEYLLRYSENAAALRTELGQLKHFNATPEEFRQIFRAVDALDNQLRLLAGATDAASIQQRTALLAQRESALRLALGQSRYTQYRLLHDPAYQDAYAMAQRAGNLQSAGVLHEINIATAEEQARIKANTNYTAEQRAIEAKRAELEQLKATARAMGQEVTPDPAPPQPPAPPTKTTHVLTGLEDLNVLSRLYNLHPDQIRALNPDLNLNRLRPGDRVNIPIVTPQMIEAGRNNVGGTTLPPPPPPR